MVFFSVLVYLDRIIQLDDMEVFMAGNLAKAVWPM